MSDRRLTVIEPGLLTTVQDLGRSGLLRFGVTTGGALDRAALILGNRLVGNAPEAAGLEITLIGPRLRCEASLVLVLTGADLGATVNGTPLSLWQPVAVKPGDELLFQPGDAGGAGARAYLCIAGGIMVEPVMGSRGTDLFAHFGGLDGRALRAGDQLPIGDAGAGAADLLRRRLATSPPRRDPEAPLRVVLGPQQDRFTEPAIAAFLNEPYTVSPKADRMGVRLSGPALALTRGADLISEGIHQGSIQVPGDGQPIALTRARQTIGGYPKIATIIGADLDALGQLRPGNRVRFAAVDVAAARAATLDDLASLGPNAVTKEPAVTSASRPVAKDHPMTEAERTGMAQAWNPAAVAGLVRELQAAGVSYLKLEIEAAGLKLELRWNTTGDLTTDDEPQTAPDRDVAAIGPAATGTDILAPMLGLFYRRPAPEQSPYVETGQPVEAGQPVGLIEVMKTYHEVTAARAGILTEFLVEDGQFVEYGQAIARLNTRAS